MSIPTFAPIRGTSYEAPAQSLYRTDRRRSHKGYEISRPLGLGSLDALQLSWQSLKKHELDDIKSFFDFLNGTGPFTYTPQDTITGPEGGTAELGEIAGGSLAGQPRYWARWTWYDSATGFETTGSRTTDFVVSDNHLLTVKVPVFPLGVSGWRVYVGIAQGDEELQAGVQTGRTWTMPDTGRVVGAPNPPGDNNLRVPRIFTRGSDLQWVPAAPNVYDAQITLLEQTAAPS